MAVSSGVKTQKLLFPVQKSSMVPAVPPEALPWGNFYRLYGVDGRYPHSLRSFPGFRFVSYTGYATSNDSTPFYLNSDGNPVLQGTNDPSAIVQQGDLVYWFVEGVNPKVGYRSLAAPGTLGPAGFYPSDIKSTSYYYDTSTFVSSGGYLEYRGVYGVAFRFVYDTSESGTPSIAAVSPPRRIESAITTPKYLYGTGFSGTTFKWQLLMQNLTTPIASFNRLQIYRTVNLASAFDTFNTGIFFLEQEIDIPANGATIDIGTLPDSALAQQAVYDPWADPSVAPSQSGAAAYYNGCTFSGFESQTGFMWTNPLVEKLEQFSASCSFPGEASDGIAKKMLVVGDYLYVFCERCIYRVTAQGSSFMITKMIDHVVPVAWSAVCKVGGNFLMVTDQGIILVNGATFEFTQIADADAVYFDDWNAQHSLECSYESYYGCVCILNATANEVMLIWVTTGNVSLIDHVTFDHCTEAPGIQTSPDDVGTMSCVFDGQCVLGDENYWALVTTIAPSTATSYGSSPYSTACFTVASQLPSVKTGQPCYVVNGTSRRYVGYITAIEATQAGTGSGYTYWFYDTTGTRITAGTDIYVGWKHIKATLPTIKLTNNISFERVHVKDAQILLHSMPTGSTSGGALGNIDYALDAVVTWYRNGAAQATQLFIPLDLDPSAAIGHLVIDGISLYPVIELWNPGAYDLEICGFLFHVIGTFADHAGDNDT
jgi:hypothetical protein